MLSSGPKEHLPEIMYRNLPQHKKVSSTYMTDVVVKEFLTFMLRDFFLQIAGHMSVVP